MDRGERGYLAWCGYLNGTQERLPEWDRLSVRTQNAWAAVERAYYERGLPPVIDVHDEHFEHPDHPGQFVAPHAVKVFDPTGEHADGVLTLDLREHSILRHAIGPDGRVAREDAGDGFVRLLEERIDGRGWTFCLPGDPEGSRRAV